MSTFDLQEVQAHLAEILAGMKPGEEVVITEDGQPLARLVRSARTSWPCRAGSARDTPHWMAPDFDAPLEDFQEYMG